MIYRFAKLADIRQIQVVRNLVKENKLSHPGRVTDDDVALYLSEKGMGWVCEENGEIIGFSIIDLKERSVWALFVNPEFAEQGIGRELHRLLVDWYFAQNQTKLTLGTAPHTRAEKFYTLQGWKRKGICSNGEVGFELSYIDWKKKIDNQP